MYKIIHVHNLVEIRAEHLLIPSDCRTRGIAAFRARQSRCMSLFDTVLILEKCVRNLLNFFLIRGNV
jgi:hypothetical protein